MSLIAYLRRISIPESSNDNFDSYLNFEQAKEYEMLLHTITLNIYLCQFDTTTRWIKSEDDKFRVSDWPPDEWIDFRSRVKKEGEEFWNNKFWLEPVTDALDQNFTGLNFTIRQNIQCCLHINFVDAAEKANITIVAVYIPQPAYGERYDAGSHRTHHKLYDSHDVNLRTMTTTDDTGNTITTTQHTFAHEIGHAIGLAHVGILRGDKPCLDEVAEDPRDGANSSICYGGTRPAKFINDIMGAGSETNYRHARPWLYAIAKHAGLLEGNFKVHTKKIPNFKKISK